MSISESFINFREFYEQELKILLINGVYIPMRKMKYPKIFAIYCLFVFFPIMFFFNCSQYLYILFECDSIESFAGNGYIANMCMMANVRAYFLFRQRKEFKTIFDDLNNHQFQPINGDAKLIAEKSLAFFTKVKHALTVISLMACVSSITTPIFYSKNGGLPVAAWYPFNISFKPNHGLVYFHQTIAIFYESLINIETDVLASGLFTFIGIQCDFLCYKLSNGSDSNIKNYVQDYQRIRKIAKRCENIFSTIYFFQFFATTSGLCMTLFLLTLVQPYTFEFFFLVVYQAAVFNLLLVPSWFSSEIRRKSENIPVAAYCYPWVDATKNMKRDLAFFIQNTQKPIQMKALSFFNLSLEIFLKIVQSSFSYYTMLKKIST